MEKEFIFVMYVEVSKEKYDSFIADYFAKNHKNKSSIKTNYNDWQELYDFKVSKYTPIVKVSPNGKYYILRELLEDIIH